MADILTGLGCDVAVVNPEDAGLTADGDDVADFLAANAALTDIQKCDAIDAVLGSAKRITAAQDFHELMDACRAGKYLDVPWPWPTLTYLTRSLLPGTVTIVSGDPGAGKTWFVLDAAVHWHREGVAVAVYMLEETRATGCSASPRSSPASPA